MPPSAQHTARLIAFAARLSSFLPWLEKSKQHDEVGDLRTAIETLIELTQRASHVYEPLADQQHAAPRLALADSLVEQLDTWGSDQPVDRRMLADFWRLVASLLWSTSRTHRELRTKVGMGTEIGAETRKQQRFSTQNAHEAWALVLEGFYEPGAPEEAVRWLLPYFRDCARRDYRIAQLYGRPMVGDSADPHGPPTIGVPSHEGNAWSVAGLADPTLGEHSVEDFTVAPSSVPPQKKE